MSITLRERRVLLYAPDAPTFQEGFQHASYTVVASPDEDGAWWANWHDLDPFSLSAGLQQDVGQRAKGNLASEAPVAEAWLVRDLETGRLYRVEGVNVLDRADTKVISAEWREDSTYTITSDTEAYTPVTIEVLPNPAVVTVGGESTQQFTATVRNASGDAIAGLGWPTWRSSNPVVLMIAATGVAEGFSPGNATVTATLGDLVGSALVTVVE